jgi:hypothetical protein
MVDGKTTRSSGSVCQVAQSWVDVGSFVKCLVLMFMIFTASVQSILDIFSYNLSATEFLKISCFGQLQDAQMRHCTEKYQNTHRPGV